MHGIKTDLAEMIIGVNQNIYNHLSQICLNTMHNDIIIANFKVNATKKMNYIFNFGVSL